MLRGMIRPVLLLACLLAVAFPAGAAQKVETRLVAEVTTIRAGEPFWVALHQRITPGWHTYWRNPGDSGEPVTIAWSLPPGFVAGDIAWPVPERIPVGPVVSFGFSDEVLLPFRITPPRDLEPGQRIDLRAHASWLVCEKECIPEDAPVVLSLAVTAGPPTSDPRWAAAITAARDALPRPSPWPASFAVAGDTVRLTAAAAGLTADRITSVVFFPYEWGAIGQGDVARRARECDARRPQLEIGGSGRPPMPPTCSHPPRQKPGRSSSSASRIAAPRTRPWP